VITSNDPTSKSEITRMSRGAQFATGFTKVITRVQERRFQSSMKSAAWFCPPSDSTTPEKQTILWADGSEQKVNPPFDQPYSFFIAGLFKIVDGKINRIEALVTPVPYGMWTGWPRK
jgi:hypothetical protein